MRRLETSQSPRIADGTFTVIVPGSRSAERGVRLQLHDSVVELQGCWSGPLEAVPALLLECALDPVVRTFTGLQATLSSEANRDLGPSDPVTVLLLRPVGSEIEIATKMPEVRT